MWGNEHSFGRRQWQPTPILLPGKSHGQRSLGQRQLSDFTFTFHFHFSLSCIGEGHGNPLQYSCLEYPKDGGAWWAPIYGVAQSRTRLKRLSSSSSSIYTWATTLTLFCLPEQQFGAALGAPTTELSQGTYTVKSPRTRDVTGSGRGPVDRRWNLLPV